MALLLLIVPWIAPALTGCTATTTIVPPPAPEDPTTVYLLDHGRTPSLVLPLDDDRMVRYAYGDWQYYARSQDDLFTGLRALLAPTQAGIGRRIMPGPANLDTLREQLLVGVEAIHPITVPREQVAALQEELDALFEQQAGQSVTNPSAALVFVPHPEPYAIGHNSNHVAAEWLAELGCEICGPANRSDWRLAPPGESCP